MDMVSSPLTWAIVEISLHYYSSCLVEYLPWEFPQWVINKKNDILIQQLWVIKNTYFMINSNLV